MMDQNFEIRIVIF